MTTKPDGYTLNGGEANADYACPRCGETEDCYGSTVVIYCNACGYPEPDTHEHDGCRGCITDVGP